MTMRFCATCRSRICRRDESRGTAQGIHKRKNPLLTLIEQAIKLDNSRQIYIRHGNLTVRLEKRKDV